MGQSSQAVTLPDPVDPAMFQAAIQTARDAVLWANAEGRLIYANDRACRWLGYTNEELLALSVWDINLNVKPEDWRAIWQRGAREEISTTSFRHKDGTALPAEVSAHDLEVAGRRLRVAFVRDVAEHRAALEALRRTQAAVDRARDPIFWVRADGSFAYVNDAACAALEYTREELLRLKVLDISPQGGSWDERWHWHRQGNVLRFERVHRTKSGREFPVEITISAMQFEGEQYNCVYTRDISDRKRAEEERAQLETQLLHAQKLESVGRLAGGVAHDFNNMLAVILGYAELIGDRLPAGDPLLAPLAEIKKAASRSRDTTRQLLAFSRKQVIAPRSIDLNALVEAAKNSLLRLIGEDIALSFVPAPEAWRIAFDPSQLEQVLVNLIVNAQDALPKGGRIAIETENVGLDEAAARLHGGVAPGDYVVLSVSDDGVGMDDETLSHIFEPFFSTKEPGKGTGLGLATVYGAIKQNAGHVEVTSAVGRGTTFRLYIPRLVGELDASRVIPAAPAARGRGTILVVEDDEMVRTTVQSMLEALGYTVLPATSARAAVTLCEEPARQIDLLLTDVAMPEMKGPELRQQVRALRPTLEVIFMSGHAPSFVVGPTAPDDQVRFLKKPFTLTELASSVASALRPDRP